MTDQPQPNQSAPVQISAGWYPTQSGELRYFDGTAWLDIAPPSGAVQATPGISATFRRVPKRAWIAIAIALVLVVGAIAGLAAQRSHNADLASKKAAAASSSAAAAAEEAAEEALESERASRRRAVVEIEASVKTMAEGHIAEGIGEGPILSVSCSPLGGGSTEDLTAQTTVFECFVANEDNGDGTHSGYKYHATQNWTTGEYTYGRGAAR